MESDVLPGRPEAARVIWGWEDVPARAAESERRLRRTGILQGLVGAGVGTALRSFGYQSVGTVVLVIAGILVLSAWLSPGGVYAAIQRLFDTLGRWTGSALTWILLPAFFFGFFMPFGLLFRRGRRDHLRRWLEPDAPSYWEDHSGVTAASSSHERQY